jgi:hypothetical protein
MAETDRARLRLTDADARTKVHGMSADAGSDALRQALVEVAERIERHKGGRIGEQNTKAVLIVPVLRALGRFGGPGSAPRSRAASSASHSARRSIARRKRTCAWAARSRT